MVLFCSSQEFESLCRDIAGKADILRLQAKGGSMHPFVRSGDWVSAALCKGNTGLIRKGDIILFKKDDCLYMHRVLRIEQGGFFVKGDMSFGSDGVILHDDVLARMISIERGGRSIDLRSGLNRSIAVLVAGSSLFLQYPFLFFRKMCSWGMSALSLVQGIGLYRYMVKKLVNGKIVIRHAGPEDIEQLSDLYRMAGHDIKEGLARIKNEGFWLAAVRNGKVVGGLTMSAYENDPALWVIFGLEVKPFFRGMGIGRAIAEAAVSKAKGLGVRQLGLFVKKRADPALGLYRSLGFKATDIVPPGFNRSSDELYLSYDVDNGSGWSEVLERAVAEGVFYPLYRNLLLSDGKDTVIPQDVRERFRQVYYLHLSRSADFVSCVERVLGFLESRKIKVLLFKGPAVDSFIYDDFMRPRLDFDIATGDEDMPALEIALGELGYACPRYEKDYPIPEYLNSRIFIHPDGGLAPVHVHRHVINNMFLTVDQPFPMEMKKVWEEAAPYKNYRYIFMLKPELNIIYLCEHALKHDFDQLIFVYEIERMIGYYEKAFDWAKFVRLAQDSGLARPVYYGLYFVQKLLSGRIPPDVMNVLKPAKLSLGETSFIKNTLQLKRSRYASYAVYSAMRRGFSKKIYFMFRTVFPPEFTFKGYLSRIRRAVLK